MIKPWGTLLITLLLIACTVGPDYHPPQSPIAQKKWSTPTAENDALERHWWHQLDDKHLNELMDSIAQSNLELAIARQRLIQARALQQADYAKSGPHLNGKLSVTNDQISQNGRILGLFPNNPLFQQIPLNQKVYQPGFDVSWELDVFGQNFRRNQQRNAQTTIACVTVYDTLRLLRAETARAYIQLRTAQKHIRILQNNIQLQNQTLVITRQRLNAGTNNKLDLALAKSQVKTTKAQLPQLQARVFQFASQIAVLLGHPPKHLFKQLMPGKALPKTPNKIAVGMPSDLLRRRPDIVAAERSIAAATAALGVAVADLYPKFNLVANASLESLSIEKLLQTNSSTWTLGPFIQWSLFQSGQIRANIHHKQSLQQEAFLNYEKTVLNALQEAETAIQQFKRSTQTRNAYQKAVSEHRAALALARQRYRAGEDDALAVIQSQTGLLQAEKNSVDAQSENLIQLIGVYKAVGGGWQ